MKISSGWVVALLSFLAVVAVPLLAFLVRGAVKWSRVEDKLETVAGALQKIATDGEQEKAELVAEMNKATRAIYDQIAVNQRQSDEAHKALDDRLRFMEQFWMGKGLAGFGPAKGGVP